MGEGLDMTDMDALCPFLATFLDTVTNAGVGCCDLPDPDFQAGLQGAAAMASMCPDLPANPCGRRLEAHEGGSGDGAGCGSDAFEDGLMGAETGPAGILALHDAVGANCQGCVTVICEIGITEYTAAGATTCMDKAYCDGVGPTEAPTEAPDSHTGTVAFGLVALVCAWNL